MSMRQDLTPNFDYFPDPVRISANYASNNPVRIPRIPCVHFWSNTVLRASEMRKIFEILDFEHF